MNIEEYIQVHGEAAYDDFVAMHKDGDEYHERLVSGKMVYEHRIYIGTSVIEIPLHLRAQRKFKDLIAKIKTQTYTATYTSIEKFHYPIEDRAENDKSVKRFLKKHPSGYSVTNETMETKE